MRIASSVKCEGWLTSSAALESSASAAKQTFAFTGKAFFGSSGRPVGKRVSIKMRSLSFGAIAFRRGDFGTGTDNGFEEKIRILAEAREPRMRVAVEALDNAIAQPG